MMTHVEDLPDELLLLILDLLPNSDLIETIPYVCLRWRRLSLDFQIWRNRTCNVKCAASSVVKFFSKKPAVKSVFFQREVGDNLLISLATHCPTITSLTLGYFQRLKPDTLGFITRNCDQIRELRVPKSVICCRERAREVAQMPRLETLIIYSCRGPQLSELSAGCEKLRCLDLGMSVELNLGDLGAPLLGRLQELTMSWSYVSCDIVHCAKRLEKLKLHNYHHCSRPDWVLAEYLLPLKALTHVDVRSLSAGPKVVRALMQPLLRSLNLFRCSTLTDDLLLEICGRCPLLENLDLSLCGNITAQGLSSMWRLRRLRRLYLSRCESLKSGTVSHLVRCDSLQELRMDDVECMEPGVSELLELRKLRVLVFNAWSARDWIPWDMLPKAFPNLRDLHLGLWKSLDTSILEKLKAAMPTVHVTWVIYC